MSETHVIMCELGTRAVKTEGRAGVWALHREGGLWCIDHVPSGGLAGRGSEEWARECLRQLGVDAPNYGAEAMFGTNAWAMDESAAMMTVSRILRIPESHWQRLRLRASEASSLEERERETLTALEERAAEVETLRAQLAEWATRCGAAETEARELREGRATWTVGDDGVRRLIVRRVVDEEVGEVGPGADPARVAYAYADGRVSGTGSHYDPTREPAHVVSHAQRIVEMLTGVKP